MEKRELFEQIGESVLQGRVHAKSKGIQTGLSGQPGVSELVKTALKAQIDPAEIVSESLNKPLSEVLENYQSNDFFFPHVVRSARCVGVARDILAAHRPRVDMQTKGTIVLATVAGDIHEIGLQIVDIMFKGAGYQTVNLGSNVPPKEIVRAVAEHNPAYIGLSAHTIDARWALEETIDALRQMPDGGKRTVLIGGSPVLEEMVSQLGADMFCRDVFQAIDALASRRASMNVPSPK